VLSGAYDVVTVPMSALRFTDRPARGVRGQGGRNGGNGAAKGEQKAADAPAQTQAAQTKAVAQPEADAKPTRPAEVTVVHDDGTQETRTVRVGVTDRVTAEIVSGLSEGEMVVVGTETSDSAPKAKKGGGQGNRGPVLFGG
jgi:macrolide-specific efflux system membrane fusion protein